jgi:Protein of unknown function (DUF3102)
MTEKAMGPGAGNAKARTEEEDDVHPSSTPKHREKETGSSTGSADALIPLIKADLRSAEKAGMPFYKAAGEKLIEAKKLVPHGQFVDWVKTNFKISKTTAFRYMKSADPKVSRGKLFENMRDFRKRGLGEKPEPKPKKHVNDDDFSAFKKEVKGQSAERELERAMAKKIIAIGYRTLAAELHPDSGGTTGAMTRLNVARDRLRNAV